MGTFCCTIEHTHTRTRAVTMRNEIRWNRLYILCGRLHCVHSNRVHHCVLTTMGRKKRKRGKKEKRMNTTNYYRSV